jgi:hypothetical protein
MAAAVAIRSLKMRSQSLKDQVAGAQRRTSFIALGNQGEEDLRRDQLLVHPERMLIAAWCRRRRFDSRTLNHSRPRRRQRLQTLALKLEAHQRYLGGSRAHPCIDNIAQPGTRTTVSAIGPLVPGAQRLLSSSPGACLVF